MDKRKAILILVVVLSLSMLGFLIYRDRKGNIKTHDLTSYLFYKVDDQNFEQEVTQESKPVLVYFYSNPQHSAAKNMLPALEAIAMRHSNKMKFCSYKMEEDNHRWKKYITYAGTSVVFKDGKKIKATSTWAPHEKVNQANLLLFLKDYLWKDINTYNRTEKVTVIDDNDFSQIISESDRPALVMFTSAKCLISQSVMGFLKK